MALAKKPVLHGEITLREAQVSEKNILVELSLPEREKKFLTYLDENCHIVASTVARHLNPAHPPRCHVPPQSEWMLGSFNVCIPVTVFRHPLPKVVIRFPLPYKIGEHHFPGNLDEKINTEAATYAWIDEHCPEVPKPRLLGFALSDGRRYTWLGHMPLLVRSFVKTRHQLLRWFRQPVPCSYVPHQFPGIDAGYLLLEDVRRDGISMLSNTWNRDRNELSKRHNLFRDLARIMLAVGRLRMPHIGSLTIDSHGYLQLNNRPLTMALHQLENEGISTGIERSCIFSSAVDYGLDLIEVLDRSLQQQPNSVRDEDDGRLQMATFASMRAVLSHFFPRSTRNGPFILQLTDTHQSNIFVDEEWRIASIIDLEFAAFRPQESDLAPYWLSSSQHIDSLSEDEFNAVHAEFIAILRKEERNDELGSPRADAMEQAWSTKSFYYQHALNEKLGCINLFHSHVLAQYGRELAFHDNFLQQLAPLFSKHSDQFLATKLEEHRIYHQKIEALFANG